MIKKKVCMLGAFAVGKTSLVARFVKGIFDERYLTTVGVKIDHKDLEVAGVEVRLMLWDLHGEDDFQSVRASYLRGSDGFVLVADGTRKATLDIARELKTRATEAAGEVPFVLMLNKGDLTDAWEIKGKDLEGDQHPGCIALRTSAKTGEGVEEAFDVLAKALVK